MEHFVVLKWTLSDPECTSGVTYVLRQTPVFNFEPCDWDIAPEHPTVNMRIQVMFPPPSSNWIWMKPIFCPKSISNWHQPLKAVAEPAVKVQSGNAAYNVTLHMYACCAPPISSPHPPLSSFQSADSWHFCADGCLSKCDMIASPGWCVCLRAFLWTRVSCNAFWCWRLARKKQREWMICDNPVGTWRGCSGDQLTNSRSTLWQEFWLN